MMTKNPDIVETADGFHRAGGAPAKELRRSQFIQCYEIIMQMTMDTIREQLWKLGWPYERIAVRVLDWEEAVTRLAGDVQSMMAMTRMVVGIEDMESRIYLVRTPDLVTGINSVHQQPKEGDVQAAINSAFKLD